MYVVLHKKEGLDQSQIYAPDNPPKVFYGDVILALSSAFLCPGFGPMQEGSLRHR